MARQQTEPVRNKIGSMRVRDNELQVNHATFGENKPTIDLRLWYTADDDSLQPGKGLNIPASKWQEFKALVDKCDEELKRRFPRDIGIESSAAASGSVVDLR